MKDNKNLHYQSATELVSALANKKISALELLEETISRIDTLDEKINAVVVRDFEQARIAAKAADAAIAEGVKKPLLGLPITVKESFSVAGLPTTWGNTQHKSWVPNYDSLAIARLKAAGAIIIGKTNVPFMLKDWQTYNDIYGTTNNPWDYALTPGGSSGGAAAALAVGFIALELGSDMGGSLRVPAHFCGVFAHKPTQHLVPMRGAAPPTFPPLPTMIDLVVAGPMARSASDLKLGLDLLAGPDELFDGKAYKLKLPAARHDKFENFRVLIIDEHPLCPTAANITHAMNAVVERLIKLGVNVSRYGKNMPDLAEITQNYLLLLASQTAADRSADMYDDLKNRVNGLSENDASFDALLSRGIIMSHREWLLTIRKRSELNYEWRKLFKNVDVILCPVMPTTAFPHDHSDYAKRKIVIDDVKLPYNQQFIWASIATLFGLPATAVPISKADNGLPIGIQVIGDYLEDYTTIQFASLLEREFGGFIRPKL